jgi:hypothetical protein
MVKLTECSSPRVAREASQWLVEYGESLLKGKRQRKEEIASTVWPLRVC